MAGQVPKEDLLANSRDSSQSLAEKRGFEPANVGQLAVSEGENKVRPVDLEKIGRLNE